MADNLDASVRSRTVESMGGNEMTDATREVGSIWDVLFRWFTNINLNVFK